MKSRTRKVLRVLFVNEGSEVTAVVENHVQGLTARERSESLLNAPVVLFLSLALPGEDGNAGSRNTRESTEFSTQIGTHDLITYAAAA